MCGIAGLVRKKPIDRNFLEKCCKILHHRGPDHKGIYTNGNIGLAITRLSVIDLATGNQPMESINGNAIIVFNGEIYNYKELRGRLKSYTQFRTNSDTEVILNGYLKWGTKVFEKLNGIFAIAIWDKSKKKIILARDSIGVKPLYYYINSDIFMFSSEIKTFIHSKVATDVSIKSLNQYLLTGYIFHPFSIIQGVRQLTPGSYLEVDEDMQIKTKNFRNLPEAHFNNNFSEKFWVEKISTKLSKAILRQTVSDVPIGLLLSSGLDSMYILETLRMNGLANNLKTFTISYDDNSYSEHLEVRKVTKKYNIQNELLFLTEKEVKTHIENMCYFLDNLEFNPTSIAMYYLSQHVGKQLKVVLSGIGGDELFYGYPTYKATNLLRKLGVLARFGYFARSLIDILPDDYTHMNFKEKSSRFLSICNHNPEIAHVLWRFVFLFDEIKKLVHTEYQPSGIEQLLLPQIKYYDEATKLKYKGMDKFMYVDIKNWLVDCGLSMWDKAGMSASLEIRVPFLDLDFIDMYLKIPTLIRAKKLGNKNLLRKVCTGVLSPHILSRQKHGFQVPIKKWLRHGLKDLFQEYTSDLPSEIFSKKYIENLWSEFLEGQRDNSLKLWTLGCLACWSRQHNVSWG